ncbi:Uncharacterized conserved protein [Burkholderia cepacia]|uniref:Uncharacterized conserved protein n=1 Tax=Burkholderia cepacia TaxID=292 RepID=A0AAE8NHX0_BURCE|nr:AAA family ATPase [Burkholderia cepacia]POM17919.1 hypothetical protein CSX04_06220 [Burkholderia cepacia]SPV21836.1 Uncharacterized conserved protein [Burkholderia cepacia]
MSQIQALGVKNFRALVDTGVIELKPITMLVGRNSVGKSTFARVLPLLRQSNEEKRRAPVLWWGKYVDFGSFADVVNRNADVKELSIFFRILIEKGNEFAFLDDWWADELKLAESTIFDLEVVFAGAHDGSTYIRRTIISTGGISCTVTTTPLGTVEGISCDGEPWVPESDTQAIAAVGELLPILKYWKASKMKDGRTVRRAIAPFWAELLAHTASFAHGNTTEDKLRQIADSIPIGSGKAVLAALKKIQGPKSWRESISGLSEDDPQLTSLRRKTLLHSLPKLFALLNEDIKVFSREVRYLEPIRAAALRYYRVQELDVGEIDSKGANLAVFINSMTSYERQKFNLWLKRHLGFEVSSVRDGGGHISLRVQLDGAAEHVNLADTGFGMSQVLPIATQLWSSLFRRSREGGREASTTFVVEQPELHLHPAFQEQLADLFVAAATGDPEIHNGKTRIRVIAETHSSSLINRLGELIAEKKVSRDDVQVVMFDQKSVDGEMEIRISEFDGDGVLTNWPYGFFSTGRTE